MTKRKEIKYREFIENNIITCDVSYRGGSLKIDVSELFTKLSNPYMGAYQNYLGGGIAGAVVGGASFMPEELNKREQKIFFELKEVCKKYFFEINNGGGDDYMQSLGRDYKNNQTLPISGY